MKQRTADTRIAVLETSIDHISHTLNRIENRIERIHLNFDEGMKKINDKIDSHFRWTLTFIVAVIASPIIASLLKGAAS